MNTHRISSRTALAGTLGLDSSELSDYRYQESRTPFAIYAVDSSFFAASKRAPKFRPEHHLADLVWEKHQDQFWAAQAGTIIWQARAALSAAKE